MSDERSVVNRPERPSSLPAPPPVSSGAGGAHDVVQAQTRMAEAIERVADAAVPPPRVDPIAIRGSALAAAARVFEGSGLQMSDTEMVGLRRQVRHTAEFFEEYLSGHYASAERSPSGKTLCRCGDVWGHLSTGAGGS